MNRSILVAAVARVASNSIKNGLLLRGSFLLSQWVGAEKRKCDDLDFLVTTTITLDDETRQTTFEKVSESIREALDQRLSDGIVFHVDRMRTEVIFEESPSPGIRLQVPFDSSDGDGELQIDIGFNDPLPGPQLLLDVPTDAGSEQLPCSSPELAFAWKLHGLVEREGIGWRTKDLVDLWLLQRHCSLDSAKLLAAIQVAFESRDGPLWRLDRLLRRKMGKSPGSRRRYARFLSNFTKCSDGFPIELSVLIEEVARVVQAPVDELKLDHERKTGDPYPSPFLSPGAISKDEMLLACNGSRFRCYDGAASTTVVQERPDKKRIPLQHAATFAQHRELILQQEARGITFDPYGRVIARPYAQFEKRLSLEDVNRPNVHAIDDSNFETAVVLEKLDGSMVFPTPDAFGSDRWHLRTRRKRSEIADKAMSFAANTDSKTGSRYIEFISHCVSKTQTPIFEWCSRSRLIVLDHPRDRLVLTGIRENESGKLLEHRTMDQLASEYSVECIKRLPKPATLLQLVEEMTAMTESEGCVLRLLDGRQFKIKSDRYLWLHLAIEGPHHDRARWYLWATGAKEHLLECSAGRNIDLESYVAELENAVQQFAKTTRELIAPFEGRKRLAKHLTTHSAMQTRLAFLAFDGACLDSEIRQVIAQQCQNEQTFRSLATKLKGPVLNDNSQSTAQPVPHGKRSK